MKITLTPQFVDSLMAQSPETAMQVLATCKQLMELDNDTIENYTLPADAHPIVSEILANMKKRAVAARRRRERTSQRKAATVTTGNSSVDKELKSAGADYQEALNLLFTDNARLSTKQYNLMLQFLNAIATRLKRIMPPTSRSRQVQRQASANYFASTLARRRR